MEVTLDFQHVCYCSVEARLAGFGMLRSRGSIRPLQCPAAAAGQRESRRRDSTRLLHLANTFAPCDATGHVRLADAV